jgi:AraC family transcriptional regulator
MKPIKKTTQQSYEQRIQQVLLYIESHLDENLTTEELSQVACLSPFHFHRIFTTFVGLSLGKYIQYLKLRRAGYQLAWGNEISVVQIALEAGFNSHEAFSRAFKKLCGLTPSQFRKQPNWDSLQIQFPTFRSSPAIAVTIKNIAETPLAAVQHQGPLPDLYYSFDKLINWARENQYQIKGGNLFGICYDDPESVPPADFRFDLCIKVTNQKADYQSLVAEKIPAGRYAIFRHFGSHQNIGQSINAVFANWFPISGEEISDESLFFQYHNLVMNVPDYELVTDIYFPLKDKE